MMLDSFKGKLLVAKPHVMKDPHFQKSVVYIYEQTDKVVIGLILNKPSYMNVADIQTMRGAVNSCLLYTSPSPRDRTRSRMPSSA